ncbi:MAG: EutN/CcmL family microcompartment protein [Spirochaetales bacterium]|nr:EutN/CcmL family microcompartment protein [Spirochaetales bacterium]
MILGRIGGQVVGTRRADGVDGAVYLLVEEYARDMKPSGRYLVVLDTLGAGQDEVVLVSQGSSARQTETTKNKAVDAVIVGIVDQVCSGGGRIYGKDAH